jgi:hypothetical protein
MIGQHWWSRSGVPRDSQVVAMQARKLMTRQVLMMVGLTACFAAASQSVADETNQYYEVRSYLLDDDSSVDAVDAYLQDALIPALNRQEVSPVGVFTNAPSDQSDSRRIVVVIPYHDPHRIAEVRQNVAKDQSYLDAAKPLLGRSSADAAYRRIRSELLIAMDCMPTIKVPAGTLDNDQRVYELRTYESANERLGDLKVDMFNAGEVPIFYECGIQPIFIGQTLIGPQTPSLTYLTMYPSEAARLKAWKAFRVNPNWQVLKKVAKYQDTVSHIDKYVLVPKPYSQM